MPEILGEDAENVAPRLLGSLLIYKQNGQRLVGKIVETEAYDQSDAASHSYKGRTPRTDIMFGPAGFVYVYFTYGMHYCFNVVTGKEGQGSAVLIRALEPVEGIAYMRENRNRQDDLQLTNGPAKLCQALNINKTLNGHNLSEPPLYLEVSDQIPNDKIVQTTRIGITKDTQRPWRFYIRGNPFVSKP